MRGPSPTPRIARALAALAMVLACGAATADVVTVVSAKSTVTTLSRNQVVDIFLGKASRYPDGNLAVPIDQPEGSAAREGFYLEFAGKSPAQLNAHWSKIIFTGRGTPPAEVANGAELKKRLAANPNTIGYIDRSQLDGGVKVVLSP